MSHPIRYYMRTLAKLNKIQDSCERGSGWAIVLMVLMILPVALCAILLFVWAWVISPWLGALATAGLFYFAMRGAWHMLKKSKAYRP